MKTIKNKQLSITKALNVGYFHLAFMPVFLIISLFAASFLYLNPIIFKVIGFFLSFIIGWLYWSFAITYWRIWAFTNVRNVHELKRKAIAGQLIWPDDSWFEKTEIRTQKQQLVLEKLTGKFSEKDIFDDDVSIPEKLIVHHSKATIFFYFLLCIVFVVTGIYNTFFGVKESKKILTFFDGNDIYIVMITIGLYVAYKGYKLLKNNNPQLILSNAGIELKLSGFIPWGAIENECVSHSGYGSSGTTTLEFDYDGRYVSVTIDELNISASKLEKALQTYRARYENNKKRLNG